MTIDTSHAMLATQAELAEALVQDEWPDEAEAAAARAAAREAATPVPERVWALQNVGSALALQGPRELARARQLLERAVLLKAEWVGKARHPGARTLSLIIFQDFTAQTLSSGCVHVRGARSQGMAMCIVLVCQET